jgi:hypothetical protein
MADCVAIWIQFDLAHVPTFIRAAGPFSIALCDNERWQYLPKAFVAARRELLLDLLLDLVLDEPYPAREVWPVL